MFFYARPAKRYAIFGPSAADPPVKRQPARQTDSQTDRQTDSQTDRQTDRQTDDPQVGRSAHSRNSRGRESPLPYIQKRFHVLPFIAIFAVGFS